MSTEVLTGSSITCSVIPWGWMYRRALMLYFKLEGCGTSRILADALPMKCAALDCVPIVQKTGGVYMQMSGG